MHGVWTGRFEGEHTGIALNSASFSNACWLAGWLAAAWVTGLVVCLADWLPCVFVLQALAHSTDVRMSSILTLLEKLTSSSSSPNASVGDGSDFNTAAPAPAAAADGAAGGGDGGEFFYGQTARAQPDKRRPSAHVHVPLIRGNHRRTSILEINFEGMNGVER